MKLSKIKQYTEEDMLMIFKQGLLGTTSSFIKALQQIDEQKQVEFARECYRILLIHFNYGSDKVLNSKKSLCLKSVFSKILSDNTKIRNSDIGSFIDTGHFRISQIKRIAEENLEIESKEYIETYKKFLKYLRNKFEDVKSNKGY